jgi:tetratricopeptide (TPR) repeat protein
MLNPEDVFIDDRDEIYIADTGNDRVLHLDAKGALIRVIDLPESPLSKPRGLFVNGRQELYIADTGNQRIVKLDQAGKLLQEVGRPDSAFLPQDYKFDPIKLVVDKRGFMYIAVLDGYQGLLQLDPSGQFQSFYGANKTVVSIADVLKRQFYTEEQMSREMRKLPGSALSVAIDGDGFLYTTSADVTTNQIKKLNIRGSNVFKEKSFGVSRKGVKPKLVDIAVDTNRNITAIDQANKVVSQYDANGNLLFFWHGLSNRATVQPQLGMIERPVAVASNSANDLFILDGHNNMLQRFRLTDFGALIHEATNLTADGRYAESKPYWEQILRLNANYSLAYGGLAQASYYTGEYKEALELFRLAGDQKGYSDTFWQLRLLWFQRYFAIAANVIVIGTLVLLIGPKLLRRKKKKTQRSKNKLLRSRLATELAHGFYTLKHPLDGFSAIRHEGKGSLLGASFILAGVVGALIVQMYVTSFSFHSMYAGSTDITGVLTQFAAIWISWVVSNYLISSIYQGEGRFRDVVTGSAYALLPLILIGIPVALLSNVFTLHEASIYNFFFYFMWGWLGLLFFWQVQSIQNYSVGETIVNLLLTVFTMIVLWVLVFIVFGLGSEFLDFMQSVYKEVSVR